MRCFKHPKSGAVGVCSSCGRGVCSKCSVEKDGKVYCKDCISKSKLAETKCFNHPRSEAIGVCSSCGRPICSDCSIDKDGKLYCRLCSSKLQSQFSVVATPAVSEPPRKYEELRLPAMPERRVPVEKIELAVRPSDIVSSTIFGGILGGFMMGLPFVNFLLFWSTLGGGIATYLVKLRVDNYGNGYIRMNDAIIIGAISGVFAALIASAFNVIYTVLLQGIVGQTTQYLLSSGLNPDAANTVIELAFTSLSALFLLEKLIATMILFAILGAVGGAIASEVSRR